MMSLRLWFLAVFVKFRSRDWFHLSCIALLVKRAHIWAYKVHVQPVKMHRVIYILGSLNLILALTESSRPPYTIYLEVVMASFLNTVYSSR